MYAINGFLFSQIAYLIGYSVEMTEAEIHNFCCKLLFKLQLVGMKIIFDFMSSVHCSRSIKHRFTTHGYHIPLIMPPVVASGS